MVVEDHDGGDDGGGHHEHDAVEICTWNGCGEEGGEKEKDEISFVASVWRKMVLTWILGLKKVPPGVQSHRIYCTH